MNLKNTPQLKATKVAIVASILSTTVLLSPLSGSTAVLIDDGFEDGAFQGGNPARTQQWYTVRYNDGGTGWSGATPPGSIVDGQGESPAPIAGNYSFRLNAYSNNGNLGAITAFESVTLQRGETLSLTFLYRGLSYSSNDSNRFRFGFLNDNGNPVTMNQDINANFYTGYMAQIPFTGADSSTNPASLIALDDRSPGGVAFPRNGTSLDGSEVNGFKLTSDTLPDTMEFSLSITRNAQDGLDFLATFKDLDDPSKFFTITYTLDAEDLIGGENAYTFNAIGLGNHNNRQIDFLIDNVVVVHVIPEPSQAALGFAAMIGLLSLLARRRERS